jgi:hypothetical protein
LLHREWRHDLLLTFFRSSVRGECRCGVRFKKRPEDQTESIAEEYVKHTGLIENEARKRRHSGISD